jgi:hypothetical protein
MKKNQKDSKHEALPGTPEARPEGGRSKGDAGNTNQNAKKIGNKDKADRVADDDGMPAANKNSNRNA